MAGGILDDLAEVFEMEEASGNIVGSIAGSSLAETGGSIANTTGKVGNCRDLESGSLQYFTIADNALFSLGTDTAFMICVWVNLESKPAAAEIVSKYNSGAGNSREYALDFDNTGDRFRFFISADNSTVHIATANNLGSPSLATWYFICAWHDPAADTINIQVNNGTANSTAHSTGTRDGAAAFQIGSTNFGTISYFDGLIDQVLFYKGGFPDATARALLYNGGNGLSYAQMQRPVAFNPRHVRQAVKRAAYY